MSRTNLEFLMSFSGRILTDVAKNAAMRVPVVRRWRVRRGRTAVLSAEQVDLYRRELEFFRNALGNEGIRGKTVAELGPGDAIPSGLLFLGLGATQYVVIDRFLGDVSGAKARALYRELKPCLPEDVRRGLEARGLEVDDYPWTDRVDGSGRPLVRLVAASLEELESGIAVDLDAVVSFNVLEHLADPERAFRNLAHLLPPGGMTAHRVDYGPHGFADPASNPLEFLTISDWLWSLMGSQRGFQNRWRHGELLRSLEGAGFEVVRVSAQAFGGAAAGIRPRLARRFAEATDADLETADCEIVLRRR